MAGTSYVLRDTPKDLAQRTLAANARLQQHLAQRAAQLQAEILDSERLLKQLENTKAEDEPDEEVYVPGACRPSGFFLPKEYLNEENPFYFDSIKRNEYAARIDPHFMNPKELEALHTAVMDENRRLEASMRQSGTNIPIDLLSNVEGVSWDTVAEKVSDVSSHKFSSTECRIKWVADQHPSINHGDWKPSEVDQLTSMIKSLDAQDLRPNWAEIAQQLGTKRTPVDVMSKATTRLRHQWDAGYDAKLLEGIRIYGVNNWTSVAQHVSPHATPVQCQSRYYKSVDPNIRRGAWTPQEDERLKKAVVSLGAAWVKVAEFIPGRTNDQCQERWSRNLNTAKNAWSEGDDQRLLDLVAEMGNQWKAISSRLGNGKTGLTCRMRYNKLVKVPGVCIPSASAPNTVACNSLVPPTLPPTPNTTLSTESHIPYSTRVITVDEAPSNEPDSHSPSDPPLIKRVKNAKGRKVDNQPPAKKRKVTQPTLDAPPSTPLPRPQPRPKPRPVTTTKA